MTILVVGADGQLGQSLKSIAGTWPEANFIFAEFKDLDISKKKDVLAFFEKYKPDWCFNCAAYTAVDKAESDKKLCAKVNTTAVKILAEACTDYGAKFFHISSDYVYHNRENAPMTEESPCTPKGVYARTKLNGDRIALKKCGQTVILRSSWVYAPTGHNFVKTMLRLGAERDQLNVVFDQIGAPTYAPDIAAAMIFIAKKIESGAVDARDAYGVFNFSNEGVTSWYDFAQTILAQKNVACQVNPIRSSQYPTPAPRPTYSLMDKAKIKSVYGLDIAHWSDGLMRCLEEMV